MPTFAAASIEHWSGLKPGSQRTKVGELRRSVARPRSNEGWCLHTRLTSRRELKSAMECKGMVQFGGATYRIVKVYPGRYDVFRLLDDVRIGGFESVPKLRIT